MISNDCLPQVQHGTLGDCQLQGQHCRVSQRSSLQAEHRFPTSTLQS